MTSDKIVARLKTAKTAPEMDTQFLMDDGSFISRMIIKGLLRNISEFWTWKVLYFLLSDTETV